MSSIFEERKKNSLVNGVNKAKANPADKNKIIKKAVEDYIQYNRIEICIDDTWKQEYVRQRTRYTSNASFLTLDEDEDIPLKTNLIDDKQEYLQDGADKRSVHAYNIVEDNKHNIFFVEKTTRAGGTTSFVKNSIENGEKFLLIAPTNKIAKGTVQDAKKFCSKDALIQHVHPNSACKYVQEMKLDDEKYEELPFILLPEECSECDSVLTCEMNEILVTESNKYLPDEPTCDGYTITYTKAIMMASQFGNLVYDGDGDDHINLDEEDDEKSEDNKKDFRKTKIIRKSIYKIINDVQTVIIDEFHSFFNGKISSVNLSEFDIEDYNLIMKSDNNKELFPEIIGMLENFGKTQNEINELLKVIESNQEKYVREKVEKGKIESKKDYYTETFENPRPINRKSDTPGLILREIENIIWNKIGLDMDKVLQLYKIVDIVSSEIIFINFNKKNNITISALKIYQIEAFENFIRELVRRRKTVLITTATPIYYDYEKLLHPEREDLDGMNLVTFGEGGDPKKTNENMYIFPDRKKFEPDDNPCKNKYVLNKIKFLIDTFGISKCMIVAGNKIKTGQLEKELKKMGCEFDEEKGDKVYYYRSSELMGVSSSKRIFISVDIAYSPLDSYDLFVHFYKAIANQSDFIKQLYFEHVYADTWQAWSRAKDPEGKEASIVMTFGVRADNCKNVSIHGVNKQVIVTEPSKSGKGKRIDVIPEPDNITKPNVIEEENHQKSVLKILHYKENYIANKDSLFNNYVNTFGDTTFAEKISNFKNQFAIEKESPLSLNKAEILNEFFISEGYDYTINGSSIDGINVTSDDIHNHLNGKTSISAHSLSKSNKMMWVRLEVDENQMSSLHGLFLLMDIPSFVEKVNDTYKIWILLTETDASVIDKFAKEAIKKAGFNVEGDGKVVRSSAIMKRNKNKKQKGVEVLLPFSSDSKIWINGTFTDEFDDMVVCPVSINEIDMPYPELEAYDDEAF
ncbi:hypothetical protein [Methanococcoides alaskense]|uniref:Uncharacterized protein n=1 Tax=Methanococcoides alaskense TaxID=325778 RepID=A0AA90Z713_9EURY|nr:hypothetical protein [Methanococcoides alaskense]MDA0525148.1 hypothetical protein [Methanococcoides alaskense]MDR6221931.1 hypothetical protein [Methanococcoides alaskense]